ncbi:MAG: hypothetical protein SFW66_07710 [Gammaproteobacteria bacterium]|nr:hypothetical protein [Gammaproteobacteria bacterium]
MKTNRKKLIGKSIKTLERIEAVQFDIASYQESIKRLHDFAEGRITLNGTGCTYRAVQRALNHKRTQEDEDRMQWTLKNIKTQMALLERELEVLLEYGA